MTVEIGWTEIIAVTIPAVLTLLGVIVVQHGKRDERRIERESSLESRVGSLERKLDDVQHHLRAEQKFSHRLVLVMYDVIHYLRNAADYRRQHGDTLPGVPPPLPDVEEITELLDDRPTYRPRDDPTTET